MTEQFTIFVKGAGFATEDKYSSILTVKGFDMCDLLGNFSTKEVLDALSDLDRFGDVVDYVNQELKSE